MSKVVMHCNVKQGRKGRTQGNALIKAAKVIDFSNLLTKNHRETKQENTAQSLDGQKWQFWYFW